MSLRNCYAQTFIDPAIRGGNYPALLRARDETGEDVEVYIKTRAGYGGRPAAPGVELLTTLLARELGLLAPEPILIEVPTGFAGQIFDRPLFRDLFSRSEGTNFGVVALGADWKTWPVEMSVRAFPEKTIENILLFDALVQQTDRGADNPNLLWRSHQIAVLDHEKCFGYLSGAGDAARPWRHFFQFDPLRTHCLLSAGRKLVESKDFGDSMWENLLALEMSHRLPELATVAVAAFPDSHVEIGRILDYFEVLFRDIEDFIVHARHALSR